MFTTTYPAVLHIKSFDNLFIELTSKYCNQRCSNCYINFPQYKKEQDFIDINLVKEILKDIDDLGIKRIYLTGAEPMTHPDFNSILRNCLKYANVCICTNGSFINEKKARFLKKVEDESDKKITFKLSLAHYEELKNDEVRYRGAFRHTVFAAKFLLKYDFKPVISVSNYYNEPENEIFNNTLEVLSGMGISLDKDHCQILPWHFDNSENEMNCNFEKAKCDCEYGRVVTSNGIYSCPFLSNDYRGRCGSTLRDFSDKCSTETNYCITCSYSKNTIFGINF